MSNPEDQQSGARLVKPHSPEWFAALRMTNPRQAAATRKLVTFAGRLDVCSFCGESPALEYRTLSENVPAGRVNTVRLCQDCRDIREEMHGESHAPLA